VVQLGVFLWIQKMRPDREPLVPFVPFQLELLADELGVVHPVDRDARYLSAVHQLPAVRARLLRSECGLTMAPSSVVMIIFAPILGRLTDKIGGKYILVTGLTLLGVAEGPEMGGRHREPMVAEKR
jgi:MFS family permease